MKIGSTSRLIAAAFVISFAPSTGAKAETVFGYNLKTDVVYGRVSSLSTALKHNAICYLTSTPQPRPQATHHVQQLSWFTAAPIIEAVYVHRPIAKLVQYTGGWRIMRVC